MHIGNKNGLVSVTLPECTFLTSACTVVTQYLYMLLEFRLYKQWNFNVFLPVFLINCIYNRCLAQIIKTALRFVAFSHTSQNTGFLNFQSHILWPNFFFFNLRGRFYWWGKSDRLEGRGRERGVERDQERMKKKEMEKGRAVWEAGVIPLQGDREVE